METMKKLVFIIAAIVCFSNTSIGQEDDYRKKLLLGIKAGGNYSNVYDEESQNFNADSKYGLAAGAFLSIPIGRYLGVQPEVLFSQKGFHASGNNYSFTRTTNYLDVPVLVAFKPAEFLTILGGPQYSYLMKQHDRFDSPLVNIEQQHEFENDNIRKNILCFVGGVDFNFRRFVFGARAGWDVQHNNGDGTSSDPRYKNVWYQGTIGLRF
jgi:hypothetical protein